MKKQNKSSKETKDTAMELFMRSGQNQQQNQIAQGAAMAMQMKLLNEMGSINNQGRGARRAIIEEDDDGFFR